MRVFERKLKNIYDMKILNSVNHIHYNKVNNISECSLIHAILNHSKQIKYINIQYYPILHGCMNTHKGKVKFNNFRIILDSGCSSTIFMRIMIKNNPKEEYVMQWNMQARNIINHLKFKIYFTLSEFRATKIVGWNFHVGYSAKGGYDMILDRYILISLVLNIKFSEHVIEEDYRPLKGSAAPMVD